MTLHRNSALQAGVGQIFDRVLSELSLKMRALRMDQAEYVALKAIVLLNPDVRGLKNRQDVDVLREKARALCAIYSVIFFAVVTLWTERSGPSCSLVFGFCYSCHSFTPIFLLITILMHWSAYS